MDYLGRSKMNWDSIIVTALTNYTFSLYACFAKKHHHLRFKHISMKYVILLDCLENVHVDI